MALAGLWLSDTPATPKLTQVPALSFIEPKGWVRFWADGSSAGGAHCNFKLNKSGENLVLTAANGMTTLDTLAFSAQATDVSQGRLPDGASTIVSFTNQTASPGYCNWAPAPVVINELLANPSAPFEDALELHNPTASAVDISGWWLSDDLASRQKFQIPAGTSLPAGGYQVFYAADFAAGTVPFEFNARGDEVILSAVDAAGDLTGYGSLVRFGASAQNVSRGRVAATGLNASSGAAEFWPLTAHTFGQDNPPDVATFRTGIGAANASPQIGPVVINEIMYHPPALTNIVAGVTNLLDNTRDEFVELHNPTTAAVDLAGWRLKGDTEFTFASGTTIPAGGFLLVVGFDPAVSSNLTAFRATYGLGAGVPIVGPYSEKLANSTFDLEIGYPTLLAGYTSYVNGDKVEYRDTSPWPTSPDGNGKSLQRASLGVIGNTAANWTGHLPTPGTTNLGVVTTLTIATTSPLTGGAVGLGYTNALAATGGTTPYTWALLNGTVPGLALAADGVWRGVPTVAGSNAVVVQVTDQGGVTASKTLALVIAATAPAITTDSLLPAGTLGVDYALTFAAAGGTAPYTWGVAGGTLPPGLSLNGAGVLTGTPTNAGTFNFTAQLTDRYGLTAARACSLTVVSAPLVITSVSPLVSGQEGSPYSQALTAVGGVTPYTWTLAGGALPPGLTLSGVGNLTGTPTNAGTYNFTVRVTDSHANTVTQALALTVHSSALTVATIVLPDSTLGSSYAQSLSATGGTPPYTWSLVGGGLPGGLGLSSAGAISGVATNVGTFSFTVQVTDHANAMAAKLFTVAVLNNPPLLLSAAQPGGAFLLLVGGDTGANYAVEGSSNLLDWIEVFTTNAPAMPFLWLDTAAGSRSYQFYRARLDP